MKKVTRKYLDDLLEQFNTQYSDKKEYAQAVESFLGTIAPVLDKHPHWRDDNVTERLLYPDRLITFKVEWLDDDGNMRINLGYRVQFNQALGPYKGGLRFDPSVTSSVVQFLGFEQTFKNALTDLPLGSGKGGADFDPSEASDTEVKRFCEAFMDELARHIGPDTDVPAGDVGVGNSEIGHLIDRYEQITHSKTPGVLTGKPLERGGIQGRVEATGYGLIYFVEEMLTGKGDDFTAKRIVVSGAGNVSLHAMKKAVEEGAIVLACSDSSGAIHCADGLDPDVIETIKNKGQSLKDYASNESQITHHPDSSAIWQFDCDIALPCAMENELNESDAQQLIENGIQLVAEGANMPCTPEAINLFLDQGILFGPGKAANAGGVVVSLFEMAQANERIPWTFNHTDEQLKKQMSVIYRNVKDAADHYGDGHDLDQGANIAGFIRVIQAMS
ncbi:NADP-specific glutamate dehydrogenase [Salisediminibacterium beveridgei]|uniref:Glutamate dehydrogenase n=1 Tax=Salisediminibacterium beveridgei TaxID=632773 RepID=A0A1D7QXS7_9BACI|nr:NADP-specific glutamate dehydrogenase [Salisediminibacterium beveridgei]AOM83809.1 NADP-specific glutamate dehydrogenase [Salisediminibacterium beveridgei]